MKKISLLMAFIALNALAFGSKTKLMANDVKQVESLEKIDVLRVYTSKKIKTKYKKVVSDQTDVNSSISNVNKKEIIKKSLKRKVKGKILKIERSIYDDSIEGLNVSFDKSCSDVKKECSYYFKRNYNNDTFFLAKVPLILSSNEELKKGFELVPSNYKKAILKVIKKEIDEVKTDTIHSQG